MAKVTVAPKLDVEITFTISEVEARALDALSGYGTDAFIKHFYTFLGEHYMKPYEKGLRTFLSSIHDIVNPGLYRLDWARKEFNK